MPASCGEKSGSVLDLAGDYTEQLDLAISALRSEMNADTNRNLVIPDELAARIEQRAA